MSFQQYQPSSGFRMIPEVVKNLLIINGVLFLATVVLENKGFDLSDTLGLHYFASEKFRIWQPITYMFMHGNFMHIAFNMFALWMFGTPVERAWGGKRFLQYYIFTGLGAAVVHYVVVHFTLEPVMQTINYYISNPSPEKLIAFVDGDYLHKFVSSDVADHFNTFREKYNALTATDTQAALSYSVEFMQQLKIDIFNAPVVVGASGAVFGLLLAFGMLFPNTQLFFMFIPVPIKAKYAVAIYGAIELFSGVANIKGDNVAHFAHLGGLLFGLIYFAIWKKWKFNRYN